MAHLFFSDTISQSGFTNISSSLTNDKNSSYIIRELLQNSLDSVLEEAKEDIAKIKFIIEKIKKEDIPLIDEYEEAISLIEKEKLSEQEKDILNVIKEELNKDEIWAFYTIDNGIGFDEKRLIAVLSDGISIKENPLNSVGSYGNGHFSVFNSSNLRYVLYAGKNQKTLFSAQAMLRSFKKDAKLKDGNGYLLKQNLPLLIDNDIFLEKAPKIINEKLNLISRGAIVCALGFNFFDDKENIIDNILATIVRNFFISILNNQLEIEIIYENKKYKLNKANIETIFEKTSTINVYPKYNIVKDFFDTYINGKKEIVLTSLGDVEVYYKEANTMKLAIVRNGMWIKDTIPSPLNRASFVDYQAYNVLILPLKNTELTKLIRRAEGNLHIDIKYNRFSDDKEGKLKRKKLKNAFEEIKQFLIKRFKKLDVDSFSVEIPELSVMMIGDSSDKNSKTKKRTNKKTNKITPIISTFNEAEEIIREKKNKKTKSKSKLKLYKPIIVENFLALHKNKKAKVKFSLDKEYELSLILRVDYSKDPTCEGFGIIDYQKIKIKNAKLNKKELEIFDNYIIYLGKINGENSLEIEYELDYKGDYVIDYEFIKSLKEKDE